MVAIKNTLLLAALAMVPSAFGYQQFEKCVKPGVVALTFDDGPNTTTPALLDLLQKEGVKATFFVNGDNYMDEVMKSTEAQNIIKREFADGHVVASHTYSHPDDGITKLTDAQLTKELKDLNDVLQELIGVKPAFFRPPLGSYNAQNEKILEANGFTGNIIWNVDPHDYQDKGTLPLETYLEPYKSKIAAADPAKDSFIALNHDVYDNTVNNIIPEVIKLVKEKGFKFVTMDECIGLKPYQNSDIMGGSSTTDITNGNSTATGTIDRVIAGNATTNGNNTMVKPDTQQNLQKSGSIATKSISALSAIALASIALLNFF